jgi:lipopolysaccharide export system permease protein
LKILDRYILKEMASTFLVGIGAFTIVLLLDKIIRLTELILNKGVGIWVALRLFLFLLPSFLTLTIPMATLLATLTTFGRMASDKEVTAMKTSGISLYRLLFPPLLFAMWAFVLNLFLSVYVMPWGYHGFKNLLFQIARSQANIGLREGVFNTDFGDYIIYVRNLKKEGRVLEGILLSESGEKKGFKVVMAKKGELIDDPETMKTILRLSEGSVHFTFPKNPALYRELSFDRYELEIDFGRFSGNPLERKKEDREMTLSELLGKISRPKEAKMHPHYVTEFHKKFSIPFASFIFVLTATPLGIRVRRSGRFSGFSLSLALALTYYLLFVLGESLGDKGGISPAFSVWIPNILLGGVGCTLLVLEARERWPELPRWFRK